MQLASQCLFITYVIRLPFNGPASCLLSGSFQANLAFGFLCIAHYIPTPLCLYFIVSRNRRFRTWTRALICLWLLFPEGKKKKVHLYVSPFIFSNPEGMILCVSSGADVTEKSIWPLD